MALNEKGKGRRREEEGAGTSTDPIRGAQLNATVIKEPLLSYINVSNFVLKVSYDLVFMHPRSRITLMCSSLTSQHRLFFSGSRTIRSRIAPFALNSSFQRVYSALIGPMSQSVVIGLSLTACVGKETPSTPS